MRLLAGYSMLSETTKLAIRNEQDQLLRQSYPQPPEERLGNPVFMTAIWQRLSDKEKEAAQLFVREASQGFFRKRDFDRLTKTGSAAWLTALTRLRRLGLVLTGRKLWSEIGFLMPLEVRELLLHTALGTNEKISNSLLTKSLSYYIPAGRGIHLDMFALVEHIYNEDFPLTKKRTIHGRSIPRLTGVLSLQPQHVEKLVSAFGPEHKSNNYPPQLALMLDIGLRKGLIQMEGSTLQVSRNNLSEWLQSPSAVLQDDLLDCFVEHYLLPIPWLEAAFFEMRRSMTDGWHSVEHVLERLRNFGFSLPETAAEELLHLCLHPLLGFGFVKLGIDETGRLFWNWASLGRNGDASGWYMESTGDLIIPGSTSLSTLWQLARYADVSYEAELVRGTLSSAKIQNELAKGATEHEILDFLQSHCFHPLPDAVKGLLDQWARTARQIRLEHVVCVRLADKRVLLELKELPSLAPFLGEIVSETAFFIAPSQERELVALLREYGYQPIQGKVTAVTEHAQGDLTGESAGIGLFSLQHSWHEYQIENVFPEYEDTVPQLTSIPKLWTQHFQSYHPKTLRDLLQRSQELELAVRIDTKNGEWEGIVTKVQVENGFWCLTLLSGKKLHRCMLEDIHRARILLPETLKV